eukprot:2578921-Prymnesium_polylepis.1
MRRAQHLLLTLTAPSRALLAAASSNTIFGVGLPPLPSGERLRLREGLSVIEEQSGGVLTTIDDTAFEGAAADLLSVGGTVWPCAAALCRWLLEDDVVRDARVLELGSGTGCCGLFAASLGAARVVLTDGRAGLVDLAADNARRNEALRPAGTR